MSDDGTIYFTDVNTNSVWCRTPDGRLTRLAGSIHSHPLWLDRKRGLLLGEHVWWIEREKRFDRFWWMLDPGGGVTRVPAVAEAVRWPTDSTGAYYRIEGARVDRIRSDGGRTTVGGDPLAGVEHLPGSINSIAVTANDRLYVADPDHRCVWEAMPDREPRCLHRSARLWTPMGVAAVGNDLYVLEDRPNGPAMILDYWQGPRVLRLAGGRSEVLLYVDDRRSAVITAVASLLMVAALLAFRWRRLRTTSPASRHSAAR